MGENSHIEWTDHTFNPWIGCVKVSPGCAHCYAEVDHPARIARGRGLELWGKDASRMVKAEGGWGEPIGWDRKAANAGERHRVFCASQSDVFEDREDLIEPRARLFKLIRATPNLDWLLLTKRIDTWRKVMRDTIDSRRLRVSETKRGADHWWAVDWLQGGMPSGKVPSNVWLGTSVEDQKRADERIPHLLNVPAAARFLSMEPLLGPVDLTRVWLPDRSGWWDALDGRLTCKATLTDGGEMLVQTEEPLRDGISWVIVGGESGPNARPMHPDWAKSIRNQCVAAGVPFFFKQWGEWQEGSERNHLSHIVLNNGKYGHRHEHCDPAKWNALNPSMMAKVGKKAAGRTLDGRTWDEMPDSRSKVR